jgi:hypothetical protein
LIAVETGGAVALRARPKTRVISNTKWEQNMTRKYRVTSSAMVPKMLGTLSPGVFDLTAKKMINENARKYSVHVLPDRSVEMNTTNVPYKSEIPAYAITGALCCTNIHRRYVSNGIGGSVWLIHGQPRRSA